MRTQEEINNQIHGLELMKSWLPELSKFGDDNWSYIEAQVDVLRGRLKSYELEEGFDDEHDEHDDNLYQAAVQAEDWLAGRRREDLFEV